MSSKNDILSAIRRHTGKRYDMPELTLDAITYEDKILQFTDSLKAAGGHGAVWITRGVKHKALYFISNSLVMLIDRNSIVNNMHEAYKRTENMTYDFGAFISGPSKTADIEQALVLGAHGPVKVLVVLK